MTRPERFHELLIGLCGTKLDITDSFEWPPIYAGVEQLKEWMRTMRDRFDAVQQD